MNDTDTAKQNAESWLQSIKQMVAKLENEDTRDEAEREIQQSVLEVSVRSGWHNIGDEMEAAEYRILLTTGGPALQITGDLDSFDGPVSFALEYQDWGTPWTGYPLSEEEAKAVHAFVSQFYFGG